MVCQNKIVHPADFFWSSWLFTDWSYMSNFALPCRNFLSLNHTTRYYDHREKVTSNSNDFLQTRMSFSGFLAMRLKISVIGSLLYRCLAFYYPFILVPLTQQSNKNYVSLHSILNPQFQAKQNTFILIIHVMSELNINHVLLIVNNLSIKE